ncbi:leucine-rich repeat domain-containing protein [Capnocytophaga cynodegmi]|uniref:hypothetical protein n=1 Tax=Capnocytophaga cynodegmi TaxID=28189 RepID=UPI0012DDCC4B|nr:hypothetical protein [Capnocytophaga cynodegmi]
MRKVFFRSMLAIGMIATTQLMNGCSKDEGGNDNDSNTTISEAKINPEAAKQGYMVLKTAKEKGEVLKIGIEAKIPNRPNVWIDLNNDGEQQPEEKVTTFPKYVEYTLQSQTVVIYGKVSQLQCLGQKLTALDVSKNPALEILECYINQLKGLNVSNNPLLFYLSCGKNQLSRLDVSKNPDLRRLSCVDNHLTTIDVSKNSRLWEFDCSKNQLTTIDVSRNAMLSYFNCSENQLKTLDISKNPKLFQIVCHTNYIKGANMNSLLMALPKVVNDANNPGKIVVISLDVEGKAKEGNDMPTQAQIRAVKNKNWKVGRIKNRLWKEI